MRGRRKCHKCGKTFNTWKKANGEDRRVAITNVRFDNELEALKTVGWNHWHVMCSPKTLAARQGKENLTAKAATDLSEQLAIKFDQSVSRLLKSSQRGQMLRVIWSDETVACPSPRIYTVAQWLQELAILEVPE